MGRRQLGARGASRDLDTWKWTRDDGGDAGDGDDAVDGDDVDDGDCDDDVRMMTRTLNSVLVKNPVQMVIECEPSFYSSSDSTLTYVT